MAEHLLDGPEIGALAEQVGREAVAEGVRGDRADAGRGFPAGQLAAGLARVEPVAPAAEEQGVGRGGAGPGPSSAARSGQVAADGSPGGRAERDHAILAPLALADRDQRPLPVRDDVAEVEVAGLGDAEPAAIEDLEQRLVARLADRVGLAGVVEQSAGLLLAEERRQAARALRGPERSERARGQEPAADQQAEKRPQRRELAPDGHRVVSPVQARQERPANHHVQLLCARRRRVVAPAPDRASVGQQLLEVGQVGAHGLRRGPPLGDQVLSVKLDQVAHGARGMVLHAISRRELCDHAHQAEKADIARVE